MTSYALLQRDPSPSEAQIRHALKDTLCRCAGYPTIIRAVQAAAQAIHRFVWHELCDWYVEMSKKDLRGDSGPERKAAASSGEVGLM